MNKLTLIQQKELGVPGDGRELLLSSYKRAISQSLFRGHVEEDRRRYIIEAEKIEKPGMVNK